MFRDIKLNIQYSALNLDTSDLENPETPEAHSEPSSRFEQNTQTTQATPLQRLQAFTLRALLLSADPSQREVLQTLVFEAWQRMNRGEFQNSSEALQTVFQNHPEHQAFLQSPLAQEIKFFLERSKNGFSPQVLDLLTQSARSRISKPQFLNQVFALGASAWALFRGDASQLINISDSCSSLASRFFSVSRLQLHSLVQEWQWMRHHSIPENFEHWSNGLYTVSEAEQREAAQKEGAEALMQVVDSVSHQKAEQAMDGELGRDVGMSEWETALRRGSIFFAGNSEDRVSMLSNYVASAGSGFASYLRSRKGLSLEGFAVSAFMGMLNGGMQSFTQLSHQFGNLSPAQMDRQQKIRLAWQFFRGTFTGALSGAGEFLIGSVLHSLPFSHPALQLLRGLISFAAADVGSELAANYLLTLIGVASGLEENQIVQARGRWSFIVNATEEVGGKGLHIASPMHLLHVGALGSALGMAWEQRQSGAQVRHSHKSGNPIFTAEKMDPRFREEDKAISARDETEFYDILRKAQGPVGEVFSALGKVGSILDIPNDLLDSAPHAQNLLVELHPENRINAGSFNTGLQMMGNSNGGIASRFSTLFKTHCETIIQDAEQCLTDLKNLPALLAEGDHDLEVAKEFLDLYNPAHLRDSLVGLPFGEGSLEGIRTTIQQAISRKELKAEEAKILLEKIRTVTDLYLKYLACLAAGKMLSEDSVSPPPPPGDAQKLRIPKISNSEVRCTPKFQEEWKALKATQRAVAQRAMAAFLEKEYVDATQIIQFKSGATSRYVHISTAEELEIVAYIHETAISFIKVTDSKGLKNYVGSNPRTPSSPSNFVTGFNPFDGYEAVKEVEKAPATLPPREESNTTRAALAAAVVAPPLVPKPPTSVPAVILVPAAAPTLEVVPAPTPPSLTAAKRLERILKLAFELALVESEGEAATLQTLSRPSAEMMAVWEHDEATVYRRVMTFAQANLAQSKDQRIQRHYSKLTELHRNISARALRGDSPAKLAAEASREAENIYKAARTPVLWQFLSQPQGIEKLFALCPELDQEAPLSPWSHLPEVKVPRFSEWIAFAKIHRIFQRKLSAKEMDAFYKRSFNNLATPDSSYESMRAVFRPAFLGVIHKYLLEDRIRLLASSDQPSPEAANLTDLQEKYWEFRELIVSPEKALEVFEFIFSKFADSLKREVLVRTPDTLVEEQIVSTESAETLLGEKIPLTPVAALMQRVHPPAVLAIVGLVEQAYQSGSKMSSVNVLKELLAGILHRAAFLITVGVDSDWILAQTSEQILSAYDKMREKRLAEINYLGILSKAEELKQINEAELPEKIRNLSPRSGQTPEQALAFKRLLYFLNSFLDQEDDIKILGVELDTQILILNMREESLPSPEIQSKIARLYFERRREILAAREGDRETIIVNSAVTPGNNKPQLLHLSTLGALDAEVFDYRSPNQRALDNIRSGMDNEVQLHPSRILHALDLHSLNTTIPNLPPAERLHHALRLAKAEIAYNGETFFSLTKPEQITLSVVSGAWPLLRSGNIDHRSKAIEAFIEVIPHLPAEDRLEYVELIEAEFNGKNEEDRKKAFGVCKLDVLLSLAPPQRLGRLQAVERQLADPSEAIKCEAIKFLRFSLGHSMEPNRSRKLLSSFSADERIARVRALENKLEDPSNKVRWIALDALRFMADDFPALRSLIRAEEIVKRLTDSNQDIQNLTLLVLKETVPLLPEHKRLPYILAIEARLESWFKTDTLQFALIALGDLTPHLPEAFREDRAKAIAHRKYMRVKGSDNVIISLEKIIPHLPANRRLRYIRFIRDQFKLLSLPVSNPVCIFNALANLFTYIPRKNRWDYALEIINNLDRVNIPSAVVGKISSHLSEEERLRLANLDLFGDRQLLYWNHIEELAEIIPHLPESLRLTYVLPIEKALQHPSKPIRIKAGHALKNLIPLLPETDRLERVKALAKAKPVVDEDKPLRHALAAAVAALPLNEETLKFLWSLLIGHSDDLVREAVVLRLSREHAFFHSPPARAFLSARLVDLRIHADLLASLLDPSKAILGSRDHWKIFLRYIAGFNENRRKILERLMEGQPKMKDVARALGRVVMAGQGELKLEKKLNTQLAQRTAGSANGQSPANFATKFIDARLEQSFASRFTRNPLDSVRNNPDLMDALIESGLLNLFIFSAHFMEEEGREAITAFFKELGKEGACEVKEGVILFKGRYAYLNEIGFTEEFVEAWAREYEKEIKEFKISQDPAQARLQVLAQSRRQLETHARRANPHSDDTLQLPHRIQSLVAQMEQAKTNSSGDDTLKETARALLQDFEANYARIRSQYGNQFANIRRDLQQFLKHIDLVKQAIPLQRGRNIFRVTGAPLRMARSGSFPIETCQRMTSLDSEATNGQGQPVNRLRFGQFKLVEWEQDEELMSRALVEITRDRQGQVRLLVHEVYSDGRFMEGESFKEEILLYAASINIDKSRVSFPEDEENEDKLGIASLETPDPVYRDNWQETVDPDDLPPQV